MSKSVKKTLEEHKGYVEKMARISFFYAALLKKKRPEKALSDILRTNTPLFYHALNYSHETELKNPETDRIASLADELSGLPVSEFEKEMFDEIKELAMKRAERFYPESVGIKMPDSWNAGSLKYDPPKSWLPQNYCCFHIANALAPESFYNVPAHLPECFIRLMNISEKEYSYDTLYTSSWLNDTPRWLALFPGEWMRNLSRRNDNVSWHFGWWGQMVTARGTFNDKAGEYLRKHGELKYKDRSSHCSFAEMRKHIKSRGVI